MLDRVIAAAEAAGHVIQEIWESGFDVEQKGSQGPVTQADRAADALLPPAIGNRGTSRHAKCVISSC